ncbi:MAG TPA: hypothetical protein VMV92_43420 [Streptosporangiaceae bacterium]|nr:hypothetical protein [Streptosporangiaceae bacterium]
MGFRDDVAKVAADPQVRRLAERRAGSHELAEDALQETYYAVAKMKNPETIRDLRAFFCKSLINEINRRLARPMPILTDDIGATSDRHQGRPLWPSGSSPPASVESEADLRILAARVLTRLQRDRDELMAAVPARSDDHSRYQSAIVAAARRILDLLLAGQVASADWNAVLKSEYPQWCDGPELAQDAMAQRLGRARSDVRQVFQAIFSGGELASWMAQD